MGKRIEDLRKLGELDQPIERQVEALDPNAPWYQFVGAIDALLEREEYDWAFATLDGIRETVARSRRVTEGQQRAVSNIAASARRRGGSGDAGEESGGRRSRRYEGFGGGGGRG